MLQLKKKNSNKERRINKWKKTIKKLKSLMTQVQKF